MWTWTTKLLVAFLLISVVIGADPRPKNRNKGKGNRDRDQEKVKALKDKNGNKTDENRSSERRLPLPKQMELIQDKNVEMGPTHRRFSGENNSRQSCRGTVQGLTPEGGRPYFRYIKVNTSSCLPRKIIYPSGIVADDDIFDSWNIVVTRLVFAGDDERGAFRIPKRISKPTNVTMEAGMTADDFRSSENAAILQTSFGFAVLFPNLDQQIKWTVEWRVEACRPFENKCDNFSQERDIVYDRNAFSISSTGGFEVWTVV